MRSIAALIVAGCCAAAVVVAKGQPPDAPPAAVFRAGTTLVPLEVSVLDHQRRPVRGLTATSFTVLMDGKAVPISTFTEVDLPATPAVPAGAAASDAPDATDVVRSRPVSPTSDEGRLVVILFDRSIPPGPPMTTARKIATAAVNQLGPADEAAVLYVGTGRPQNFTANRRLLLRAINGSDTGTALSTDAQEQWGGTDLAAGGSGSDALTLVSSQDGSCYCGLCVPEKVAHIAQTLRDVPRRKSVLFIGDAVTWQDPEPDCVGRLTEATDKMYAALNRSNITIHSLSPSGLQVIGPIAHASSPLTASQALRFAPTEMLLAMSQEGSLHVLPDYTGGRVVSNTNAPEEYVPQIFAESASYYVLGVPAPEPGAKAPSKIKVTVNRNDVDVRARREYVTPPGGPVTASQALAAALPNFVPARTMLLAATLAPFAVSDAGDPLVLVVLHVRQEFDQGDTITDARAAAPRSDRFNVVTSAFDEFARPKAADRRNVQFTFHGDGALEFEVLSRLALKPGRYEIRIGASGTDPTEAGSLSTYLDVPDFAKVPLSLSGVVLTSRADHQTVAPDTFKDVVPIVPTARRSFAKDDVVEAFLRVYEGGGNAIRPTSIAATIQDASNREVWRQDTPLDAGAFDGIRAADARITVPVDRLGQGTYVMTVRAGEGQNAPTRAVRFTIAN